MSKSNEFTDALVAHLPSLRRYAVALVGNAALADDLVQDCIERALRQSTQLRELHNMSGWLRRILHNRFIDDIRRNRGRGTHEDIADFCDHPDLAVQALDSLSNRDFVRAMNALTFEHRQILLLVGLEELSYRSIADELGIPIGTVMSRLARARERLRNLMQDGGAEIRPFPAALKEVR